MPSTIASGRRPAVALTDGHGYRLRHVAPTSRWASEGATTQVLGVTYGYTWLPTSGAPGSADLVTGGYTRRLGDAGDFTLTFPNAPSSKGHWRSRFDPDGPLEWVEIYRDGVLEFVGSVQSVQVDRGSVTVSGPDAMDLLKRCYELDRTWTAGPWEVIQTYTRLPRPLIASTNFPVATNPSGTVTYPVEAGAQIMRLTGSPAEVKTASFTLGTVGWRLTTRVRFSGGGYEVVVWNGSAPKVQVDVAVYSAYVNAETWRGIPGDAVLQNVWQTLTVERQGRWLRATLDGTLIAYWPAPTTGITTGCFVDLYTIGGGNLDVAGTLLTNLEPFLARGTDPGDLVLPTDQPIGGLRGRYWNDADLAGFTGSTYYDALQAPGRESYAERLDGPIDTGSTLQVPVKPGAADQNFSVCWFGAVYLRGDLGNYTFECEVDDAVRLWVGKTAWGDQLLEHWADGAPTAYTGTWNAAMHGSRAGWYPIVMDYAQGLVTSAAKLRFTPPATYTDPGGTAITGAVKVIVPKTSLSPLGCYDQRAQGTSHYDLVTGAATSAGYQLLLEPMQLESGEFPGRLVPRLRVGRDTDVILEPEESDRVEPALNPSVTTDSTDQVVQTVGSGAGLGNGTGQAVAQVTNHAAAAAALFVSQAMVDAGDVAFQDLLAARLDAELALRATPWEEVQATPRGLDRLADTWPLSASLAAMRWQPGDGLRIRVPDIGVEDTAARQITQVTRQFTSDGRTSTALGFRQRPRSAARALRGLVRSALAARRAYQGQVVTLQSSRIDESVGAGALSTGYMILALQPRDVVVRAYVRCEYNALPASLGMEVNGTDQTTALGGPWSLLPLEVDITALATQASATDNRLFARWRNTSGAASSVASVMFVEVLR